MPTVDLVTFSHGKKGHLKFDVPVYFAGAKPPISGSTHSIPSEDNTPWPRNWLRPDVRIALYRHIPHHFHFMRGELRETVITRRAIRIGTAKRIWSNEHELPNTWVRPLQYLWIHSRQE